MDKAMTRTDRRFVVPACHITEDEAEVLVGIEMPGVSREGLDIKVDGNTLTIDGTRSDEEPQGKWLLRERRRLDYRKVFTIDESIDREGISAELAEGVLNLRLKVKEAAKPRRIAIG
ncbi:MAG TPA: Hsp20/alpha crystallin family protein [Rectinemataceae bacterium]|nr:Hsp20/alpha crystallin family protein [Rectinemataceae bacterium]